MSETLKPCPFCGGMDVRHGNKETGWRRVICRQCNAEGPSIDPTLHKGPTSYDTGKFREKAAFSKWNRRAPDPLTERLADALRMMAPEGWLDDDTMDHMPGIKEARAALRAYEESRK